VVGKVEDGKAADGKVVDGKAAAGSQLLPCVPTSPLQISRFLRI
jgi:hypothetical protein